MIPKAFGLSQLVIGICFAVQFVQPDVASQIMHNDNLSGQPENRQVYAKWKERLSKVKMEDVILSPCREEKFKLQNIPFEEVFSL